MNLLKVQTENEFNKIVKGSKQNNESVYLLFTSPWEKQSNMIKEELLLLDNDALCYEVDYFRFPHTYCAFRTSTPSLVKIKGNRVKVLSNLISIRNEVGLASLLTPRNS